MASFNTSALIGYTGFVGSNLQTQFSFTDTFNSKNIQNIQGKSYDLVVCAGVSAVKWWANKNPAEDWAQIEKLLRNLETVKARHFVLISTTDVYANPKGVNESSPADSTQSYGSHRLKVEEFVKSHFSSYNIIRLPGLFGQGLKKNVIYDLMNDNCLEMINPRSSFQYYNLDHLWSDIQMVLDKNIKLINMACEPISTATIIERFFPGKDIGAKPAAEGHYDMQTQHGGPYQYGKEQTLQEMGDFIKKNLPKKS